MRELAFLAALAVFSVPGSLAVWVIGRKYKGLGVTLGGEAGAVVGGFWGLAEWSISSFMGGIAITVLFSLVLIPLGCIVGKGTELLVQASRTTR